jgi:nicotinamide mononucleotide transporter
MTTIEILAVFFGFVCVWLTLRQNIWCWPTGLVQVVLFIYIFHEVKLYSDLILHVIYVGMQLYGWYFWLHGGRDSGVARVSRLARASRQLWLLSVLAGSLLWGYLMARYTDASLPYGDAFTTVASLAAQWLLARKKLESWLLWISVDVVAIGIYWSKGLLLTSGLYMAFLLLAILGFFAWRRSLYDRQWSLAKAQI